MAENDSIPSFHGESRYGIDGSRRVMIPAKWRPQDPGVVFTVLAWPLVRNECLLVLPPKRWELTLEKLRKRPLQDGKLAAVERTIGRNSAPLTLDKVGRFCLPDGLAKLVGIEKEVEFVGRLDKFEMWNPARYAAVREQTNEQEIAAMVDMNVEL